MRGSRAGCDREPSCAQRRAAGSRAEKRREPAGGATTTTTLAELRNTMQADAPPLCPPSAFSHMPAATCGAPVGLRQTRSPMGALTDDADSPVRTALMCTHESRRESRARRSAPPAPRTEHYSSMAQDPASRCCACARTSSALCNIHLLIKPDAHAHSITPRCPYALSWSTGMWIHTSCAADASDGEGDRAA